MGQVIRGGSFGGVIGGGIIGAPGAPPNPNGPKFTVKGTVVNAMTGEPISGVLVELTGTAQASTFVGSGGRFQFDNIPQGQVSIVAQKPGFLDQRIGGNPFAFQNSLFMVGPNMKDAEVKLIPESQITGRIVNEDGDPLHGIIVQVMWEQVMNGRKRWMPRGGASTNANGQYRIENLPSGRYLLHTSGRAMFVNIPATLQQAEERGETIPSNVDLNLGYPPTYYPNATDLTSAQPLDVKPGEEAQADFNLRAQHGFHVGGVVIGAGSGNGGIMLSLVGPDGQQVPVASRVNPQTGVFRLPLVFPGTWTLVFHSQQGPEGGASARQTINVTNADLLNLRVQLQPLASVPVQIDDPPAVAAPLPQMTPNGLGQPSPHPMVAPVQVQLIPNDPSPLYATYMSRPRGANPQEGQGSLSIPNVPPGSYRAVVLSFGTAVCLDTITAGNADLSRSEYTVPEESPAPPIHVTLRTDCASLKGTVRSELPNPTGMVILVSKNLAMNSRPVGINSDGSFSFMGLPPGDYEIHAISNVSGLEYDRPDGLKGISGQDVHLDPNQSASVTVDLVVRGDSQ